MKLLHIDTGREMRGGQYQALLLLQALRDAGHHSVLLARPEFPLWNAASGQGIELQPANIQKVWRLSRTVDLVHAHDAHAHTLAAAGCRGRFVVARRVAFAVRQSPLSRWKYARARRFLAVSRFVARELSLAGIPNEKIDVVYDAVETRDMTDWNPELPAVALSSHDPQKGRELIELAANTARIPIRFSDDLAVDLPRASMFVYITRSEGLGSAALLAMQAGIPVIASRVGGLSEIVEDAVTGLSVENDVLQIAKAMQQIRADRQLTLMMIAAAKTRVMERFSVVRMLRDTLASYRTALDS